MFCGLKNKAPNMNHLSEAMTTTFLFMADQEKKNYH